MHLRRAACVLLITGSMSVAVSPPLASAADAGEFCSRVSPGDTSFDVADPALIELSGLAASRAYPGVLWAHNDSGDTPRLFAMFDTGAALGVFDVAGAAATDWEDIAVGPGPIGGQPYIYIGDIGDNNAVRDHVTVYRVAEPSNAPNGEGTLDGVEAFDLTYPGGAEDAESLLVDPLSGDVVIITKQVSGASKVLSIRQSQLDVHAPVTMTQVATMQIPDTGPYDPNEKLALPSTMATSADVSTDGTVVLVRTYQQILAFARAPGQSIGDALGGTPCSAPQVAEPQGEAIAFSANGDRYFTSGEVQLARQSAAIAATDPLPLARFDIAPLPTAAPTTTVAPTSTTMAPTTTVAPTTTETPATTAAPTTTAAVVASVTTVAPATTSTSISTRPTTNSSSHWWLWSGIGLIAIGIGLALLLPRRRRPRRV
ncbi:MAG: hypothetical protein JWN62_4087 [Acidimicrobiales bacterium]|nr:hypothetical protein [Acidimicrobiales bacterium]